MDMAATPEEFLFIDPEPPSPSIFLDLPPNPTIDGDDPAAFDDMVLPYVSRLLMEEEDVGENNFFYQYPDHPVLLQAQLPFAQILSDATTSNGGSATPDSPDTNSTFAGGGVSSDSDHSGTASSGFVKPFSPADGHDLFTSAFLKGMEEGSKFLPTNNPLLLDQKLDRMENEQADSMLVGSGHVRGRKNRHAGMDDLEAEERRASKFIMPETEDAAARQMFDEMMLQEQDVCMKGLQRLRISTDGEKGTACRRWQTSDTVDLHTLLLHCAQAVATDDRRSAHELLRQIKQHSTPSGDGVQRLAYCFAEGLEARLAGTGSQLYRNLMTRRTSVVDFLKAYKLFMAACCCKKVAFVFSNKTIYDAVAGKSRLHIVDYGLSYGFQWPGLLRGLAAREGGPPEVRITGIDLPQPGFRPACQIEETGRRLSDCAREFSVPFRFHGIAAKRETVRLEDLNLDPAEVLVVSNLCHFRHVTEESVVPGQLSPRDLVLNNIRKMRPDVFIHGVLNGMYGTTYFSTRFRELLFFYSAQFDLLDATVPRDSVERMLVERDIFGAAALNVIACEGTDRVERPETYKQWQVRNHRAGLRQLPLNPEVVKVVLDKVKDNYHKDFVVDEDQRWLLHRWKGRVLYALSTWVSAY